MTSVRSTENGHAVLRMKATRKLTSKAGFTPPGGPLLMVDTPGSGGDGPPGRRTLLQLAEAQADGYVSADGAEEAYRAGLTRFYQPLAVGSLLICQKSRRSR